MRIRHRTYFLVFFIGLLLSVYSKSQAQTLDSTRIILLDDATITDRNLIIKPISLEFLDFDSLLFSGYTNLPEAMKMIPGVQVLSTGPGNNKPAIRGAFGNRLIILYDGLKFGNQQWQEEHGLGLGTMGISGIEVIKGPMSILYGSEAIAGVIKLKDELAPLPNTSVSELILKAETNGLGFGMEGGYKENKGRFWTRVRASVDNYADYSDGNNHRVLNSRYDAYRLKMSIGKLKGNRNSVTSFYSSLTRNGFLFKDLNSFAVEDSRWSRRMDENPSHFVILNMLNTTHSWYINESNKLSFKGAIRHNQRLENEGSGAISLNMSLFSQQYHLTWEHKIGTRNKITLSHLLNNDFNKNYGARVLVPDAHLFESNLAFVVHSELSKAWQWENGIGAGYKFIRTKKSGPDGPIPKEIGPFNKRAPYTNASSSIYFQAKSGFSFNAAIASGVRVPNLAELASEGLHEGFFTYEIGNPNLNNEKVVSINLGLELVKRKWSVGITPFVSRYFDYIFLAPTMEQWFGFPVYRYAQTDAFQYGGEARFDVQLIKNLRLNTSYSAMVSQTIDGRYLPYTPPQKVTPSLIYTFRHGIIGLKSMNLSADLYSGQNQLFTGELATPAYQLVNIGFQGNRRYKLCVVNYGITVKNLFNESYYDHLSRLKLFGLLNQGRSITFQVKIQRTK